MMKNQVCKIMGHTAKGTRPPLLETVGPSMRVRMMWLIVFAIVALSVMATFSPYRT
jgi:hypothetical protein